ncbi:YdeI/OmpD-associated family protein [Desertivirga brevis]|uniref:YdeI/OmpD-associated family protein n=1 Tax=Desertivirga brevis TaxID=2810310 RepID=UPI001A967E67
MKETPVETFYPASRQEWREWLKENHKSKEAVWILQYRKNTNKPSISWSEAVDEALCFGWIDSIRKSIDKESFIQFFCPRKARSAWSKINKAKVEQLINEGLMTEAGYKAIETAKENGSWTILDEVEELLIPAELERQFESNPGSKEYFITLSKSVRKMILQWVAVAKRPETREKRVREVAELAAKKQRPKQF